MAVKELSSDNFETAVSKGKSVVDFFATWCGPCKMLSPIVDAVSEQYDDISFYKVDIDKEMDIAMKYKIMSVPTLIVFENGEAVGKSIGLISGDELADLLK